jgi:hypothetical protein
MLWKAVYVPALTFCNASLRFSNELINRLDKIQYQVGKFALGVHSNIAKAFIDGELAWSSFEAREARSKISFYGRLKVVPKERFISQLHIAKACLSKRTLLDIRVNSLRAKYKCHLLPPPTNLPDFVAFHDTVKYITKNQEDIYWRAAVDQKRSLQQYSINKVGRAIEKFYDNTKGSALLAEARSGLLKTREFRRNHFDGDAAISIICPRCKNGNDELLHILYECQSASFLLDQNLVSIEEALGWSQETDFDTINQTKRILDEWFRKTVWF